MTTTTSLLRLDLRTEQDVVLARQRARQVAALLGFDPTEQTHIATAASEIARNALQHAGGGTVDFLFGEGEPPSLAVRVRDRGPGIADLRAILEEPHKPIGQSRGLLAAKRLMDRLEVEPASGGGSTVLMARDLPKRAPRPTRQNLARVAEELAREAPRGPLQEVQQQNRELLLALDEIHRRQAEMVQLNRELEETNRGVVALYAELDEKAFSLQKASEQKSRFLSDMSHEFRTPLNSIRSLSQFLLDRADGELTPEQERQVRFIRKAADGLAQLVNDLLDLSKVEAGKATVRPEAFEAADLFATLRGMIRPLLSPESPTLVFDEPVGVPPLLTDEGKVAQILRNFLSNALKFTPQGEVRVSASAVSDDTITFAVSDTGIGIATGDLGRIFEDFAQVDGPLQRKVQGTGLGLPLSRKLAELLGGSVSVGSMPGVGSTFTATIPRIYPGVASPSAPVAEARERPDPSRFSVLLLEDDPATSFPYARDLEGSGFQVLAARSVQEARQWLREFRPAAVLLDILLEAEGGWSLLAELKGRPETRDVPVLVLTLVEGRERATALGADEFGVKPVDRSWLLRKLQQLAGRGPLERVLIVDDDEVARYLLKSLLPPGGRYAVAEAADGLEGLRKAREEKPHVIFLDLVMPEMSGFEVLERLKADAATRDIPVIINSSTTLDEAERRRLNAGAAAILSKAPPSREQALASIREALGLAGLPPAPIRTEPQHA